MTNIDTYIFIDVSNIRGACIRSCGLKLDFTKLYSYFERKYPKLKEVRYYEGIASNDKKREAYFKHLEKVGYKVCPLKRRRYVDPPKYEHFVCKKCNSLNSVEVKPAAVKLKSNVDVYLASDMIELAATTSKPIHIILVSCDGDYTEAINTSLRLNPIAQITILATPAKPKNNCLSSRLQAFASRLSKRTTLMNIETIKDYIS